MNNMQYIVTGMIRSGSTVTWQILDDIVRLDLPQCGLLRSHGFIELEDDFEVFVCYRDFRDVIMSIAKVYNFTISQAARHCAFVTPMKALSKQKVAYWDHSRCHFIKYEDYFPDNISKLVAYIYEVAGLTSVEDWYKPEHIAEKFSLEKAKVISEKYKIFDRVDPKSMIHGNHITSDGKVGNWKKVTNAKDASVLESVRPMLEEFGYED